VALCAQAYTFQRFHAGSRSPLSYVVFVNCLRAFITFQMVIKCISLTCHLQAST